MKATTLFNEFVESEKSGGVILVLATFCSIALANSPWQHEYSAFWQTGLGDHSVAGWINDGLMSAFFLLIGLELEREIYHGELSVLKSALLPIVGALGGMVVPVGLYLVLNLGPNGQSGAGIPMATDIAFAIGILSLLGRRVPISLKVFLTALAVIDDLGAIIVIAFFYTASLSYPNLLIALLIFGVLLLLNRLKVLNLVPYLIGGLVMWYFMLHSGIHATIAGVFLAFAIPFGDGSERSPSYILQHTLHKPVAFLILPLFAIANTGITIGTHWYNALGEVNSLGIIAGLVIGKPLGIWLFSSVAVALGICALPSELKWKHIIGVGLLAGIGFTMSIFITLLAFDDGSLVNSSKIAVLSASLIAGAAGFMFLKRTL